MAYPAAFDESNAAQGDSLQILNSEFAPLSVLTTVTESGLPIVLSCWKLTQEELNEINVTRRIWLTVMGEQMPPVMVAGHKPKLKTNEVNDGDSDC